MEEILAERDIVVTYETVRQWCLWASATYEPPVVATNRIRYHAMAEPPHFRTDTVSNGSSG